MYVNGKPVSVALLCHFKGGDIKAHWELQMLNWNYCVLPFFLSFQLLLCNLISILMMPCLLIDQTAVTLLIKRGKKIVGCLLFHQWWVCIIDGERDFTLKIHLLSVSGVWKLLLWRAAFCFTHPKEVSKTMQKKGTDFPVRYSPLIVHCPCRPSENMLIRANTDGTYSANWTPGAVGLYTIHVTIDGIEIGNSV